MLAIRKVRSYEEDFDAPEFCKNTENIYKQIHEAMAAKDLEKLENLVTERAYPEVVHNIEDKTIHWKYLDTIELPRIVHARCTDVISKDNIFGQVTVRFHTKQVYFLSPGSCLVNKGGIVIIKKKNQISFFTFYLKLKL